MRRLSTAARGVSRNKKPARSESRRDNPLVLYVEDNAENWEVTRLHLESRFRLLWAKNDTEACRLLSDHHRVISTILMDIELKGSQLDGIQLTKLVRGRLARPQLPGYASTVPVLAAPIFFLTAHSARYTEADLTAAGGNRLITKPVNFAELSEALTKVQLRAMDSEPARAFLKSVRDEASLASLSALLDENASLEARLLALLRNGVLGGAEPLESFDAAYELLGPQGLRPPAIVLAVADLIPVGHGGEALLANSLRRAVAARLLAQKTGQAPPDASFALGLLLDAGLIARAQHDLRGALEVVRSPAGSRVIREKAAGDLDHPIRAAQIAGEWGLDDEIRQAIECHHESEPAASGLAKMAWLAERIAGVFETGEVRQHRSEAVRAATEIGVPEGTVTEILEAIPSAVEAAAAALGRAVPRQPALARLLEESNPSLAELHESYSALVRTLAALVDQKDALAGRLRQANDRLAEKASTDGLTGLANRHSFNAAFKRDLADADRSNRPISLIMTDLDHFKQVNDRAGHLVGDEVLRTMADTIRRHLRRSDLAARYGGEEFVIILPDTNLVQARQAAERLRYAINDHPYLRAVEGQPVTASFGVASLQGRDCSARGDALINAADEALYAAKRAGRDRVEVASAIETP